MDLLLLAFTLVSVAAAIVCGALTWRTLREQRLRENARVAALADAIDSHEPLPVAAEQLDVRFTDIGAAASGPGMFEPERSAAGHGAPLVKAAVGITMTLIIIVAVAMANRGPSEKRAASIGARASAPLELVSMRHARSGETLTVSGLVRNPRNGATVDRVTAVVFAFDRAGSFVASGRASLDFLRLEPGDESPFVVTIPNITDVGRYRVSFRTDSGVVRHVDRRGTDHTRLAAAARLQ